MTLLMLSHKIFCLEMFALRGEWFLGVTCPRKVAIPSFGSRQFPTDVRPWEDAIKKHRNIL